MGRLSVYCMHGVFIICSFAFSYACLPERAGTLTCLFNCACSDARISCLHR